MVNFRRQQREPALIHIDGAAVEKVKSFKILNIHIPDNLTGSIHTDCDVKKVQQRLFNLRSLKKLDLAPKTLTNFYRCTIESIPLGCITACYGYCTVHNHRALQRVVRSAQRINRGTLPALQDIYSTQCHRKAKKIIKDLSHPACYHPEGEVSTAASKLGQRD
jgi:hypothetical protein